MSHEDSRQIGVRSVVRITKNREIPSTPKIKLILIEESHGLSITNC